MVVIIATLASLLILFGSLAVIGATVLDSGDKIVRALLGQPAMVSHPVVPMRRDVRVRVRSVRPVLQPLRAAA
jgi:hypothetical protein